MNTMFTVYNTSPNQKFSGNKLLIIGIPLVCIVIVVILVVTLLLSGKNPPSKFSLDLSAIKNSEGDFSFHELKYGGSLADVEAALGVEVPSSYDRATNAENFTPVNPDAASEETGVFFPEDTVSLNGSPSTYWNITLYEDGFYGTTFHFSGEDIPDLYLDTVKELTDLYGVCRWNFERGPLEFSYIGPCIQEAYNWAEEDGDTISVLSVVLYMNEVEDPLMIFSLNRVPVEIPDTLPPGQAPPETLEPFDFSMLDAVS